MKRLTLTAALLSVAFGALVLAGAISLGSDRADGRAVIGAFAVLMLSFGVLTATKDPESEASSPGNVTPLPDVRDLPAVPGSLHGRVSPMAPRANSSPEAPSDQPVEAAMSPFGLVQFQPGVPVGRFENLSDLEDPSDLDALNLPDSSLARDSDRQRVDESDEAVDEIIVDLTVTNPDPDEDTARTDPPPAPTTSDSGLRDVEVHQVVDTVFTDDDPWDLDHVDDSVDADTRSTAAASLSLLAADPVPSLLHLGDYSDDDLMAIVKESEATVIRSMIASGQLSSSGALTDRDVATMIFLAYTSSDMLTELRLRKVTSQPLLHSRAEIA